MPDYISNGFHVMVSQNSPGELTVGGPHHYGATHHSFDDATINQLIQDYLGRFANTSDWSLVQTWNGTYPKILDGRQHIFLEAQPGIYILN